MRRPLVGAATDARPQHVAISPPYPVRARKMLPLSATCGHGDLRSRRCVRAMKGRICPTYLRSFCDRFASRRNIIATYIARPKERKSRGDTCRNIYLLRDPIQALSPQFGIASSVKENLPDSFITLASLFTAGKRPSKTIRLKKLHRPCRRD